MKRRELEQSVKAEATVNVEPIRSVKELGTRPKLYSIRRNGKVVFNGDALDWRTQHIDVNAARIGEGQRRWIECRMKTADAQHKIRVITEIHEETHLSFHGHEQDSRVEHCSEEPDPVLGIFDCDYKSDVDDNDGSIFGGQCNTHQSDNGDVAWNLDDNAQ